MKFGKYLASRQLELPEYSGHFIDYKALKKLIKQLAVPSSDAPAANHDPGEMQKRLKENKAQFFFRVERELDKVNLFYLEKQANLAVTLELLEMKKTELFQRSCDVIWNASNDDVDLRHSISYLNLYQNFKKIHQDLLRLQQYIELNESGFSKVVKKWDKRSKSHTKELFISTAVSVQPVFHKDEINELSDRVTSCLFDLEAIMDGDYTCLRGIPRDPSRRGVMENERDGEIDELYASFINVATLKDPDMGLLARWIEKATQKKREEKSKLPNDKKENGDMEDKALEIDAISSTDALRLSKILLLSLSNLKISDNFLQSFLSMIGYSLELTIHDDFHNERTILHECCSIPASSSQHHVSINNGVRVVNSTDSIDHSRVFLVEHVMATVQGDELARLLVAGDSNGRTCVHYASLNSRLDLLDIILPRFPRSHIDCLDSESMSALVLAIRHGNLAVVKRLVEMGANCFPQPDESRPQYLPLNYACRFGDYDTVQYLLSQRGSDPSLAHQPDVEGLLPLHVISRAGHHNLIALLMEHNADPNKLDGLNKWPPIFYAASEGHVEAAKELVRHGARLDVLDEDGYNVCYYCVMEGHLDVLNELLGYRETIFGPQPRVNRVEEAKASEAPDVTASEYIPDLRLPPPILPLRRYGHNFLEQKVLIELIFPPDSSLVSLFNSTADLKPGRITLTSNLSDIVPRNILLPVSDETKAINCVFQTDMDSLSEFRIDFEIFPKFGTRLIAKTTALSFSQLHTSSPEVSSIQLPLFDLRLKNIGELRFNYQVIYPFAGNLLETSKFDTYWKSSTSFVKNSRTLKLNAAGGLSPNNFLSPSSISSTVHGTPMDNAITSNELVFGSTPSSVVTATSLSGEYLRIKVCLLNDGTPVVCPHWSIAITNSIELYLPNLSLAQLSSITNNLFDYKKVIHDLSRMTVKDLGLIKKLLKIIYLPLHILLEIMSVDINLSLEMVFPSLYELETLPFVGNVSSNLNNYIDFALNDVFNHIRSVSKYNSSATRSIIFLSSNSLICKVLNWKQPNFPVFLIMSAIAYKNNRFEFRSANGLTMEPQARRDQELTIRSIHKAVNFSINNNLIGIITSIHLLNLVPMLVPLIRSRGLILVASYEGGDDEVEEKELDVYTRTEINGLRFDDVLSFRGDI